MIYSPVVSLKSESILLADGICIMMYDHFKNLICDVFAKLNKRLKSNKSTLSVSKTICMKIAAGHKICII